MKLDEFNKMFTGVVITLTPKTLIKKDNRDNYLLKRILSTNFSIMKNDESKIINSLSV